MNSIGERLKALRTEQGMTLAELGEKTNLSTSYLSQIERDKTTPSLATLTGVAKTLDVSLRYFFETDSEPAHVVRADQVRNGPASDSAVVRTSLAPTGENNKLHAYYVVVEPHSAPEQLEPHPAEELVFVLAGELTISVGDEEYVLGAGDSIHYDALLPHSWSNRGDDACQALWSHATSWSERQG